MSPTSREPHRHHSQHHSQRRSRSPKGHRDDAGSHRHKRRRTASPKPHQSAPTTKVVLPLNAQYLHKRDLESYRALFATYLDIQKELYIEDLSNEEVRGRWKSFVGKWNRAELAEGWYDPTTKSKADSAAAIEAADLQREGLDKPGVGSYKSKQRASPQHKTGGPGEGYSDDESDSDVGPSLPGQKSSRRERALGPAIPNVQDLEMRKESSLEREQLARADLKYARKIDRKEQKEALDELAPRAGAGTRERQLEKKKELNEKMRAFRDKSPGAVEEVAEGDLMGGGDDDGIEGLKKKKVEMERKKNERELRKDDILRARAAEREERLMEHRAKEDKTMQMLKALAKQNFG